MLLRGVIGVFVASFGLSVSATQAEAGCLSKLFHPRRPAGPTYCQPAPVLAADGNYYYYTQPVQQAPSLPSPPAPTLPLNQRVNDLELRVFGEVRGG